jgi:hypothetical protein
MAVEVRPSLEFLDALMKLTPGRQQSAVNQLYLFARQPDAPELRFRELRCAPGYWIINSHYQDRIILRAEDDGVYSAVDVGGHELYAEWERRAGQGTP